MTLKDKMEAVWEDKRIASATHLVRWNENTCVGNERCGLWYTKGKKSIIKRIRK